MKRSSLFGALVTVILVASLFLVAPPLSAQEKPADRTADKDQTADAGKEKRLTAATQNTDSGAAAPVIFFPEPLHDFGTIATGAKVTHIFKVLNKGDAPLRVTNAKGS
jgi:hypothetical protein